MLQVNPYLTFKGNCRDAIEFYKTALSAETVFIQTIGESPMANMGPAGNIMHARLKIGDSVIFMSDDPTPDAAPPASNFSLAIAVRDPELAHRLFDQLSEDGKVNMQVQKTYWSEAFGMLTDRFGVRWMVNCEAASAPAM